MKIGGRARVADLLARRPDGGVRGAARRRRRHLHGRSRRRKEIVNLTNDDFADYGADATRPTASSSSTTRASAATRSCSGSTSTRRRRRRSPSAPYDETAAQFIDDNTIVFSSTATDPAVPLDPEVAKNGNIYNIWTLDLSNGELRQYTDALGGNWSPVVLNEGQTQPHRVHQLLQGRVQHPHARAEGAAAHRGERRLRRARARSSTSRRRSQHTLVADNARKKKHVREDVPRGAAAGERRRHEQRRHLRRHRRSASATCSATSSSTVCIASIAQYRTLSLVVRQPRRGASSTRCRATRRRSSSTGSVGGVFYDSGARAVHRPRRWPGDADGPRRDARFGIYPLDRYRRLEFSGGLRPAQRAVQRSGPAGSTRDAVPGSRPTASTLFRNGIADAARRRVRPGDDGVPRVRAARRQHDAARVRRRAQDRRHCCRARPSTPTCATTCGSARSGVLATRFRGFKSIGEFPDFTYFGGNSEMRGYDYLQFVGQNVVFAERRAALPAHRGGADADRRHRRHPRRVLRQHRRRLVRRASRAPSSLHRQSTATSSSRSNDGSASRSRRPDRRGRLSDRRRGQPIPSTAPTRRSSRLPPEGRPRLVRHGSRNLRARASRSTSTGRGGRCSTRNGKTCVFAVERRQQRVPQAALRGLDRLRLLAAHGLGLRAQARPLALSRMSPES